MAKKKKRVVRRRRAASFPSLSTVKRRVARRGTSGVSGAHAKKMEGIADSAKKSAAKARSSLKMAPGQAALTGSAAAVGAVLLLKHAQNSRSNPNSYFGRHADHIETGLVLGGAGLAAFGVMNGNLPAVVGGLVVGAAGAGAKTKPFNPPVKTTSGYFDDVSGDFDTAAAPYRQQRVAARRQVAQNIAQRIKSNHPDLIQGSDDLEGHIEGALDDLSGAEETGALPLLAALPLITKYLNKVKSGQTTSGVEDLDALLSLDGYFDASTGDIDVSGIYDEVGLFNKKKRLARKQRRLDKKQRKLQRKTAKAESKDLIKSGRLVDRLQSQDNKIKQLEQKLNTLQFDDYSQSYGDGEAIAIDDAQSDSGEYVSEGYDY